MQIIMKAPRARKNHPTYLLLFLIPITGILVACGFLLHYNKEYKIAENEYQEITHTNAENVASSIQILESASPAAGKVLSDTGSTTFDLPAENIPDPVDFASLVAENKDVVGWIAMPLCNMSYPIVKGEDNIYYLTHTYKGTENKSGAIFMDPYNDGTFTEMHTLLYGHNMKNGSMFGGLKKIRDNPSVVNDAPFVYIFTPDGKIRQYRVFACRLVEADDPAYRLFTGSENYDTFVQECLEKSKAGIYTSSDFSLRLPILSLSTCAGDTGRFLVHCVLVNIF